MGMSLVPDEAVEKLAEDWKNSDEKESLVRSFMIEHQGLFDEMMSKTKAKLGREDETENPVTGFLEIIDDLNDSRKDLTVKGKSIEKLQAALDKEKKISQQLKMFITGRVTEEDETVDLKRNRMIKLLEV